MKINGFKCKEYKIDFVLEPGQNALIFTDKLIPESIEYSDGLKKVSLDKDHIIRGQYYANMRIELKKADFALITFPCRLGINLRYRIKDSWYHDMLIGCEAFWDQNPMEFTVERIIRNGRSLND
jgi:hypothetical protein